MPYLHCPRCQRTSWLRTSAEGGIACRHCGTTLNPIAGGDARFLTRAVRERFARDARLHAGRPRFVRDPDVPE
jgi:ribosomal protein S27E